MKRLGFMVKYRQSERMSQHSFRPNQIKLNRSLIMTENKIATQTDLCKIKGCTLPRKYRKICHKHYARLTRLGGLVANQAYIQGIGNTPEEKFWSRVDKTSNQNGCWEWTGGISHGYGIVTFNRRLERTHRISWFLQFGVMPNFLLHSCDNRKCVNTEHLREGDHQENAKDRVARDRTVKGEKVFGAKLKEAQVREIKQLILQGLTDIVISKRFGVSDSNIYQIRKGNNWKWVK
jgi:hypothetical protein